jgi:hypothetical protein
MFHGGKLNMSNIIDITSLDGFKANQNEKIIDRELFHPNPEVLKLWKAMVKNTLKKFPSSPEPSVPALDLSFSENVSVAEQEEIVKKISIFLASYKEDVARQNFEAIKAIALLQKEIAEYQASET